MCANFGICKRVVASTGSVYTEVVSSSTMVTRLRTDDEGRQRSRLQQRCKEESTQHSEETARH